ncbi:MAG: hypothetical protein M1832_002825 [Thelocarpon impressellum]|nr:MAG: hypothetical protein M1832_002825 [Thelocarpon impressellum]
MGFPTLQPAFTLRLDLSPPFAVGESSRGAGLNVIPLTSGSLVSEPGFEPKLDATLAHGADFVRADPDGGRVRLNVGSVWKNHDGSLLSVAYTGLIEINPSTLAVLQGSAEAKTTEFGGAFTHLEIETGSESLKPLERAVFVAAGRFVIDPGRAPVVEYKASRVGA